MNRYSFLCAALSLLMFDALDMGTGRADIFRWEYINTALPGQRKRPRPALCQNARAVLTCVLAVMLGLVTGRAASQDMTFDEIRKALRENPPSTGDPLLREEAIVNLDAHLETNDWPPAETTGFYDQMTGLLGYELSLPIPTGARIWQVYNHGFIIKTPSTVIAFDLTGYFSQPLAETVLQQIDVLFTSHNHSDHWDRAVHRAVTGFGGEVITSETENIIPGINFDIGGLDVVAFYGAHSVKNYIFQVTTPEGLTIMHTGDTQYSQALPGGASVDILLINAWMNESGSTSATFGVRNAVNRVSPSLTIPGHIHELGHAYDPGNPASRVPYEWALAVDDVPIPGKLAVVTWGEHVDYGVALKATTPTAILRPTGLYSAFDLNIDGMGEFAGGGATGPVGEFDATINRMERLLAKFDLPNLSQSHSRIENATLRLFLDDVNGTPQGPASVFHSLGDNDVIALRTDYQNDDYYDTSLDLVQPTDAPGRYYELDVTYLVMADYAAEGPAAAVSAFRLQVNEATFVEDDVSRRYVFDTSVRSEHPVELIITFIPEPATLFLALMALAGSVRAARYTF